MVITPAVIEQARRWQASIMLDQVRVERQTGTVFDRDTMTETPTYMAIYAGPGRVQAANRDAAEVPATGTGATLATFVAAIPWDATAVEPGDILTVATAAHDPALTHLVFRVDAVEASTFATARRLHLTTLDGVSRD